MIKFDPLALFSHQFINLYTKLEMILVAAFPSALLQPALIPSIISVAASWLILLSSSKILWILWQTNVTSSSIDLQLLFNLTSFKVNAFSSELKPDSNLEAQETERYKIEIYCTSKKISVIMLNAATIMIAYKMRWFDRNFLSCAPLIDFSRNSLKAAVMFIPSSFHYRMNQQTESVFI